MAADPVARGRPAIGPFVEIAVALSRIEGACAWQSVNLRLACRIDDLSAGAARSVRSRPRKDRDVISVARSCALG